MSQILNINNFDSHLLVTATDQSNLIDHVPAMVYKAHFSPNGLVLRKDRPSFNLPQLRFGRHKRYVTQITSTYDRDGRANSVLLSGEKGTGKSLLAEELANWMLKQDLPVIMVNEPMGAEELSIIIRAVGPCMVYFDEFGKVYHRPHDRERLLSLFSDTSFVGVMFVITGNGANEFSDFLHHRPQRFMYCIDYSAGVDEETLEDIIATMKVRDEFHEILREYIGVSDGTRHHAPVNIDSLMCVVRQSAECKTPEELIDHCEILNVPPLPCMNWYIKEVNEVGVVAEEGKGFGWEISLTTKNRSLLSLVEGRAMPGRYQQDPDGKVTRVDLNNQPELTDRKLDFVIRIGGFRQFDVVIGYGYERRCQNAMQPGSPHPDITRQEGPTAPWSGSRCMEQWHRLTPIPH
ncbi:hypothetical protein D3C85_15680 [compost metagenome]